MVKGKDESRNECQPDDNGIDKIPHQTFKNYFWVLPSYILITTPRILNLTFFISSFMVTNETSPEASAIRTISDIDPIFGYIICTSTLFVVGIAYSVSLILTICCLGIPIKKLVKTHLMNLGLGVLTPCIVLQPKSSLILVTSFISTLAHICLCSSLLIIQSHRVTTRPVLADVEDTCLISLLQVCLILTLLPSYFLHWMSDEERRQKFGLITGLIGPLSCDTKSAFIWACEKNYLNLLLLSKKYLRDKKTGQFQKDEMGYNAVQWACARGKSNKRSRSRQVNISCVHLRIFAFCFPHGSQGLLNVGI